MTTQFFRTLSASYPLLGRAEAMRMREEADMRSRVQAKRHETLERGRRAERLMKIKDDRRIRAEILRAAKGEVSVPTGTTHRRGKKKKKKRNQQTTTAVR